MSDHRKIAGSISYVTFIVIACIVCALWSCHGCDAINVTLAGYLIYLMTSTHLLLTQAFILTVGSLRIPPQALSNRSADHRSSALRKTLPHTVRSSLGFFPDAVPTRRVAFGIRPSHIISAHCGVFNLDHVLVCVLRG